ncbi:mitochondrial 54S ribosomal protein YmL41 [Sorochytrium milnesiophthora]
MAAPKFRLHLPNIIFRLVRAPNLPTNQVAFRVPQKLSKVDIWQYLTKIYQVPVHKIATMNYNGRRTVANGRPDRTTKFKKAVVTLSPAEAQRMHGSETDATFKWPQEPTAQDLDVIRLPELRKANMRGKGSMKRLFANRTTEIEATAAKSKEETAAATSPEAKAKAKA